MRQGFATIVVRFPIGSNPQGIIDAMQFEIEGLGGTQHDHHEEQEDGKDRTTRWYHHHRPSLAHLAIYRM